MTGDPARIPAGLPVVAVVGPTAVGKSDLAVELARRLGGEIVNADAMQLYRGMDVGTAKLTTAQRRGVPHHQLDVLDVTDTASVAAYQRQARLALADIAGRGRVPLLVGGSGLYVSAVLSPLEFPGTDPALRADLEAQLAELGPAALHARLDHADPAAAAAIPPGNGRRIVRALEVVELTGAPFRARLPAGWRTAALVIGLDTDRSALDAAITARVDRMWRHGLVAETRALELGGLRRGVTARRALGYAQILEVFDGGVDEAAARTATVAATRRFARRQLSWFHRDATTRWLDAAAPDVVDRALAAVSAGAAHGVSVGR